MIKQIRPTSAYLNILPRIPCDIHDYILVVIHYNDDNFVCTRWTTRTRDILKKHAKMLHFDECNAYLFEPSRFHQFENRLYENEYNSQSFVFLAYKLCGKVWNSVIEEFSYDNVCSVEYYQAKNGSFNGLSHWKIPKSN